MILVDMATNRQPTVQLAEGGALRWDQLLPSARNLLDATTGLKQQLLASLDDKTLQQLIELLANKDTNYTKATKATKPTEGKFAMEVDDRPNHLD